MIFRQLFDQSSSTYTYLLADERTREAILVDCVFEQHLRDLALIRELELKLVLSVETHVHADHVTGAWLMRDALGSRIAVARASGATGHDVPLEPGDALQAGRLRFQARATPGHTDGCMTFVCAEAGLALTGDALLIRGAGRTDFQGGDANRLFRSVREEILSLPDSYLLYPAHDYSGRTVTSVWEENAYNPRLGALVNEADFVGYMANLGLPHPKKMDAAVPANLTCGRPSEELRPELVPTWGPVVRTYAGVWQIEPDWVFQHRDSVSVVDVRERDEIEVSPLGTIPGSTLLPLSELRESLSQVPAGKPVVVVCPSGARSAIATTIIARREGVSVANLAGGLSRWVELGYPRQA